MCSNGSKVLLQRGSLLFAPGARLFPRALSLLCRDARAEHTCHTAFREIPSSGGLVRGQTNSGSTSHRQQCQIIFFHTTGQNVLALTVQSLGRRKKKKKIYKFSVKSECCFVKIKLKISLQKSFDRGFSNQWSGRMEGAGPASPPALAAEWDGVAAVLGSAPNSTASLLGARPPLLWRSHSSPRALILKGPLPRDERTLLGAWEMEN